MPAPSSSRRQRIVEAIRDRLRGMTSSTTYHYPVGDDSQVTTNPTFNLLGANGIDLPVYVVEVTPDGSRDYFPDEQLREIVRLTVTGRQDADAANEEARLTVWENMIADLEVAFGLEPTLGGLVVDTRLGSPAPFVGVGSPVVVVQQPLEVRLYRTYGVPV